MIVDKKGNMFEDRRKQTGDRRQNDCDVKGGRRGTDRRKAPEQIKNKK